MKKAGEDNDTIDLIPQVKAAKLAASLILLDLQVGLSPSQSYIVGNMIFFSGIPKPKNVRILLVTFAGKGNKPSYTLQLGDLKPKLPFFSRCRPFFALWGSLPKNRKILNHLGRGGWDVRSCLCGTFFFSTKAVSYLVESTEGYMASLFARFQQARRISYYTYTALFRKNVFEFEPKCDSMMVR